MNEGSLLCQTRNRLPRVLNFTPSPPTTLFRSAREAADDDGRSRWREAKEKWRKTRKDGKPEGREARDEREKEEERKIESAGKRKRKRKMVKSVNFLTFYEPSEFHNLEPVRVVLCTRKVSALAPFSRTFLFSLVAFSRHFRERPKTARGKRGRKARCVQRIIAK